uniref:Uncharacterized protein n=1 Tax=Anguilla anguilla TaxID=7936 RepID=A0A0E9PVA6_ANGAN
MICSAQQTFRHKSKLGLPYSLKASLTSRSILSAAFIYSF